MRNVLREMRFSTWVINVILAAEGGDLPLIVQRAFLTTKRLAKKNKPLTSMVIGWSGMARHTEFDLHSVTPSIENFSNRSAPLITGFPIMISTRQESAREATDGARLGREPSRTGFCD